MGYSKRYLNNIKTAIQLQLKTPMGKEIPLTWDMSSLHLIDGSTVYLTDVLNYLLGYDEPDMFYFDGKDLMYYDTEVLRGALSGRYTLSDLIKILKKELKENTMRTYNEGETAKCPDCGKKYLVNTGYCVSCKKKVAEPKKDDEKKESFIVTKDTKIPDSDYILERGDRVEILNSINENNMAIHEIDMFIDRYFNGDYGYAMESLIKYLDLTNQTKILGAWIVAKKQAKI